MTLDQLRIFVAVATCEHMTRAARIVGLTQPAVSAAISNLEERYGVRLFHRVGRGIEITEHGRALLDEARAILDRVASTELMMKELGGLRRGSLRLAASQTIGGYWLPPVLEAFRRQYPGILVELEIVNSGRVADDVRSGRAELGFVEGPVDETALELWPVATDRMVIVQAAPMPDAIDADWVRATPWILREAGSGTRSTFEAMIDGMHIRPSQFDIAHVLPTNEAVRSAAQSGAGAALLSMLVVSDAVSAGKLHAATVDIPLRPFVALRHRERYQSQAASALTALIAASFPNLSPSASVAP